MFRHGNLHRRVLCFVEFLILLLFFGLVSPFQISAAPPAQDVDLCALLPAGGRISVNSSDDCLKVYTEYSAPLDAQIRLIRPGNPVPANVAIKDLETMVCKPSGGAKVKCARNSLGDYGFSSQVQFSEFSEYWNRGCYNVHVRTGKYDGESLLLPIALGIDARLKGLSPCPPAVAPGRLNVGIGGNYDAANERVDVTAGVENRPNVGIGDDYYEWTLDGAPIQKGKELKSIEYDTTNLAEGEHEIVVKVTDRVNNVSGGATFKFTIKRNTGKPHVSTGNAYLQTGSGKQPVTPGQPVPGKIGSQEEVNLWVECALQVYHLVKMQHPEWFTFYHRSKSRNLPLFVLKLAFTLCDGLRSSLPYQVAYAGSDPSPVLATHAANSPAAQAKIEVTEGLLGLEITNKNVALDLETGTTNVHAFGKNIFAVGYDPAISESVVAVSEGQVTVQPKNPALAPVTLQAGQSVLVTADKIGSVEQTPNAPPNSSVPGTTLSLPPFGAAEPYPSVTGRTIQFAQRRVPAGETVLIPVWLMNANDVANINVKVTFDANVARPEGNATKGYLLDNALFSANAKDSGIVRMGFAQATNLGNGTGTLAYIPFRAVGNPGDRTTLTANVTTLNNQDGGALSMDRINGEIVILNKDGTMPGGNGTGSLPPGACSGKTQLTELDALCALEISVQLKPAMLIMDVDGNGAIDSRDAVLILMRVVGGQ